MTLYENKSDWIGEPFRFWAKIEELSAKAVRFFNSLVRNERVKFRTAAYSNEYAFSGERGSHYE